MAKGCANQASRRRSRSLATAQADNHPLSGRPKGRIPSPHARSPSAAIWKLRCFPPLRWTERDLLHADARELRAPALRDASVVDPLNRSVHAAGKIHDSGSEDARRQSCHNRRTCGHVCSHSQTVFRRGQAKRPIRWAADGPPGELLGPVPPYGNPSLLFRASHTGGHGRTGRLHGAVNGWLACVTTTGVRRRVGQTDHGFAVPSCHEVVRSVLAPSCRAPFPCLYASAGCAQGVDGALRSRLYGTRFRARDGTRGK